MEQLPFVVGLYQGFSSSETPEPFWLETFWQQNLANGYNFTQIPLLKNINKLNDAVLDISTYDGLPEQAFTRKAHCALSGQQWLSVGGIFNLPDKAPAQKISDELLNHLLREATSWATYQGMHSITLDLDQLIKDYNISVHVLAEILSCIFFDNPHTNFQFWVKTDYRNQSWGNWNALRNSIGYIPKDRLHVILNFSAITKETKWDKQLQRWFGESIQAISVPTTHFKQVQNGEMSLAEQVQTICAPFFKYPSIKWLIEGPCLGDTDYAVYSRCLARLHEQHHPSDEEMFLVPSNDHLQRPMQPLFDNLVSSAYELFEKDPVKYVQYENAIRQAVLDNYTEQDSVTVMVLGAGRGPLVDAAIRATDDIDCKVRIFVIEKNPTALVTLHHRARDDWANIELEVVATDMRDWDTDERADIIVSELLGSWADNELSPECLDGAQHLLKPNGINIPQAYTSWLAPVSSARLHYKVAARAPLDFPEIDSRKFFEDCYVVKMGAVFPLTDDQACFTFQHPNTGYSSNKRFTVCEFEMPDELSSCIVHGFRGTFEAKLYGEHIISILPKSYSTGMFCWFPLYIPLEQPLTLKGGTRIEVLLWRKVSNSKVWYEWMVKDMTQLHNQGGRSSWIGL